MFVVVTNYELEDFVRAEYYCPLALADSTSTFALGIG